MRIFSLLLIATTVMIACKKDTDPADKDFFVGTYRGSISYQKDDNTITSSEGKVTVSKVGETYNFFFGNNIPDIKGVKFEKSSDNNYVSVGSGVSGISINASTLKVLVANNGATWTADCTR